MAHGLPDGALSGLGVTVFPMQDLGELAARLGSIVTFNREGNVIFLDDFRHTLTAWKSSGSGAEADVYPVVTPSMRGGMAIMLKTGAAEDEYAEISHILHYPAGGGIGVEVGFVPADALKSFRLGVRLFDGEEASHFQARYNHEDGTLGIRTGETTWSHVATVGVQHVGFNAFVSIKLVGNVVTSVYKRIIFNGVEYELNPLMFYAEDDDERRSMGVFFAADAGALGSAAIVIDDVIVTQNEPT